MESILDLYGEIWTHDRESEALEHSVEARLVYHKEKSLPIMESIMEKCELYLASTPCEEHGGFGKACKYFIKHYEGLTQFCKVLGAPIDNNRMEEGLKIKIRSRKMSHFYKTQIGADVANVLTSVIATAYRNDVNPFHYLNYIQRHSDAIKADSKAALPWDRVL